MSVPRFGTAGDGQSSARNNGQKLMATEHDTEQENLASMKAQVYKDPRPQEFFDRFHARVRTRKPNWVYELVRVLTSLYAWIIFRARGRDAWKVPSDGGVILAPNHFSF